MVSCSGHTECLDHSIANHGYCSPFFRKTKFIYSLSAQRVVQTIYGAALSVPALSFMLSSSHAHSTQREKKTVDYRTRVTTTRFGLTFIAPKPPTHCHIRSALDVTTISTLTQQRQGYTIVHYSSIYSTSKTCPFSVHNHIILILMSSLTPNSIPNPIP